MLMELLDVSTLEVTGYLLSGVPGEAVLGKVSCRKPCAMTLPKRGAGGDSWGPGEQGGAACTAGQARPEVLARSPSQHPSDLY